MRSVAPVPAILATVVLAAVGATAYLAYGARAAAERVEARVDELGDQLESLAQVANLLRFEQRAKAGAGMPALLEQMRFWAPKLGLATTPSAEVPAIRENLRGVLTAMQALGPDVFGDLVEAFLAAEPGEDDMVRTWLLHAMLAVDPDRARGFLERTLQSLEFPVAPRTRLLAAQLLIEADAAAAGSVLQQVLQAETHRGLDPMRLAPELRAKYPGAEENVVAYQGFYNFIPLYVSSGHEDIDATLLAVLGRRHHHDFLTLQAAADALGQRGYEPAVDPIKDLFEHPPPGSTPMFRNHMLDALGAIQGADACDFFRRVLPREKVDMVVGKLTELIKQHCSS